MNKLILLAGLPRSGKTTEALRLGFPIVCPGAIRLALHGQRFVQTAEPYVWAIAKTMVKSLFLAGNTTVVVDATNLTEESRSFWAPEPVVVSPPSALGAEAKEELLWEIELRVVRTSEKECSRRASSERDYEIMPVIEKMATSSDLRLTSS